MRLSVILEGLAPLHRIPEFPGSIFGHPLQHPFQFINLTTQSTYSKSYNGGDQNASLLN
jgi:hypothetical protein